MENEHPSTGTGAPSRPAAKRPVAVTLVGWLAFIVGAYHVVDGVVVLVEGGGSSKVAEGATELALGVLAIVIGNGALRMRRWAWAAFMTWAVVGLLNQLLRHFFYDDPNYAAMAVNTAVVLILTPLDVQVAFGVRPPRNVVLDLAPRNPLDSH